jgi:hypothetical protein
MEVLDWLYDLHGEPVTMRVPVALRDLSQGGFALESSIAIPEGAEHQFRFTAEDGTSFAIAAVATHTHPVPDSGTYITGFRFLPGSSPDSADPVRELIDKITLRRRYSNFSAVIGSSDDALNAG